MGKHRAARWPPTSTTHPVFLAKSAWEIGYVAERFPKVAFSQDERAGISCGGRLPEALIPCSHPVSTPGASRDIPS